MSKPPLPHTPHNLHLLMLLLLLLPALACKALLPGTATPVPSLLPQETNMGVQVTYPTGIETYRLDSGTIAVADTKGYYCIAFPAQWEVGAFHEDFIPTVEKYAQTYAGIKLLFDALYGNDNSLRIFAIDTSAGHLSESNMTAMHIGMFQEEWRLKLTLDDIAAEYIAYVTSSGQIQVTNTFLGKSQYDIPYIILLTETVPGESTSPVYGGTALVQTDYAYLEIMYTTLDKSTQVVEEMYPMLNSFTTCNAQGDNN